METPADGMFDPKMACRFYYTRAGNKCAQRKYKDLPENGVVECSYDSVCRYDIGNNEEVTMDCLCGFNAEGKSYCPLDHFENSKAWADLYVSLRKAFDNECHTRNRFSCPESSFGDVLKKRKLVDVQYYKAVDCAESVLNSAILRVSFSLIILAIII